MDISGMFTSPQQIRQERLDDLRKRQAANSTMGGSYNQLLGQIAAGGGVTGGMLAEGLGRAFGMKSAEEAKAEKIQGIAQGLDATPESWTSFAKQLNSMGMPEQAIKALEYAQSLKSDAAEAELAALKLTREKEGVFKPVVFEEQVDEAGFKRKVYKLYNETTGTWRNLDGTPLNTNKPTTGNGSGSADRSDLWKDFTTPPEEEVVTTSPSTSGQMKRAGRTYSSTPTPSTSTGPRPRSRQ